MTLNHMRIYLEVYRMQNVTRAAENLYMTQPAVSRAIKELEKHYGVRLFERINHKLYITDAGHELYSYALHITSLFNEMERGFKNWDEFGILRIGASISMGTIFLPRVLSTMRKKNPDLHVKSTVANGYMLQKALLDDKLDFAVIECGIVDKQLNAEVISRDELIPVLPPDSLLKDREVSLSELAEFPMLLREKDSAGRIFLDHIFALHEIRTEPVMESISTWAILQAVHTGLGISFLPRLLVEDTIRSGLVATCHVVDETFQRENCLVWHKQKFLTNSAKEAMSLFRKYCSAGPDIVPI